MGSGGGAKASGVTLNLSPQKTFSRKMEANI